MFSPQGITFKSWATNRTRMFSMVAVIVALYILTVHSAIVMDYIDFEKWSLFRNEPDASLVEVKPPRLLRTLEETELRYQKMIERRHAMIKARGGPNQKSFPDKYERFNSGLWDLFLPAFSCPFPVYRIGTLGDGGKWICGIERALRKPDCVVYSMGVERSSSFEEEILLDYPDCQIYGFDYSVEKWGPQIKDPQILSRAHFYQYMISNVDDHDAHPKKYTLQGIMEERGHTFVDILKVDIEGAEWETLISLINSFNGNPLPFGQLQIELHIDFKGNGAMKTVGEFSEWWEKLEGAGLRPFWLEVNLPHVQFFRDPPKVVEWCFINIRGNHTLIDYTIEE